MFNFLFGQPEAERDVERTFQAMKVWETIKDDLLKIPIRGKLLPASLNEDYQHLRSQSFSFFDCGYPAAIFVPIDTQDLSFIVSRLGSVKCQVNVSGGRHSHCSYADNGITLDLKNLDTISVNLDAKFVDVGGGCRLSAVDMALNNSGYAIVTGTNGDTGVGGLTLAGGWGYLSRANGFACDLVVECEVVLADGKIVLAQDSNEHAALMKALRGGGGEFGIVTRFRFQLVPVNNCIYGQTLRLAPTVYSAEQCFLSWRNWIEQSSIPNEVSSLYAMPCGVPVSVVMGIAINLPGETHHDIRVLKDLVDNSTGHWLTLKGRMDKGSYHIGLQKVLETHQVRGYSLPTGLMIKKLSDEMIKIFIHYTRVDYVNKNCTIILTRLGGKMHQETRPSSLSYREANYWAICNVATTKPHDLTEIKQLQEWMARFKQAVMNADEGGGLAQPSHGFFDSKMKTASFLLETKRLYDPNGMFGKRYGHMENDH